MNRPSAAEERKQLSEKDKLNNPGLEGQFGQPKKRRVGAIWIVIGSVVVLVAAIWWVNHQHAAAEANPFAAMRRSGGGGGRHGGGFGGFGPLPVVATAAESSDLHVYLNGLGTVTPLSNITLRTQISGQLTAVNFTEGQLVKKGDLLATIDSRPYQVALEQAQGNLEQAQAQLRSAKADLTRYQTLAKQDSIAEQQVDTQSALVSQYEGLVQADQAAIDNAKLNITYCHIVAPVDGRVGLRQVDAGNYVTPGDSSGIVVLTEVNPITVIFTLPEDYVPKVSARLKSGANILVEAWDRSMTTVLASGKLATIDNQVDVSTGTFKLRGLFNNDKDTLFPNQFVNVRMLLDTEENDIVIPTSAVERGQDGTYAYVVVKGDDGSTVTVRNITLGSQEGERVAVVSGLKVGEQVVSDGADKLKDGAAVIVQTPNKPAAKPAGQGGQTGAPGQGQHRRRNGQGGPGSGGQGGQGNWTHRQQGGAGGQGPGTQGSGTGGSSTQSSNSGGSQQ